MLILSRRVGESLCIGEDVTVTVLDINGKQARIGVTAPPDVSVHREEIFRKIEAERKARKQADIDAAYAQREAV